jgi:hypothetical protein
MTAMVFSDWIAESMLDLLSISIKITGDNRNIQEAAYSLSSARMTRHRISGSGFQIPHASGDMAAQRQNYFFGRYVRFSI